MVYLQPYMATSNNNNDNNHCQTKLATITVEPVVTNLSTPHQTLFRRTFYICCTSVVKKSLHVQCHVFYKIFQEAHVSRLHYPFGLVSFS